MGDDFNKTPTELRYGDETYSELTFNTPDTGHLPEQKNEIATSRIVLDAMGLPDKVGTQMELTFTTDTDTFTDTFTLCGIWDGDAVAYRQTMLLSKAYTEQVAPVIHGETDGTTPPVGTGYIDTVMMMPTAWNIEKQALDVTSEYGLDERVSINDAYGMATVNLFFHAASCGRYCGYLYCRLSSNLQCVLYFYRTGYSVLWNVENTGNHRKTNKENRL